MMMKDIKLTSDIVIERVEIPNMPDPEASEQTHNDALLEMDAEPIEEDPEEDLEEDLMEGQRKSLVENEPIDKDVICLLEDQKSP